MNKKLTTADIIWEDGQILVLEKKPGVVVNRSQTNSQLTLQDDLIKYFGLRLDDLGIGERAGIVHRLDRETSGLMLVAKTNQAFDFLQKQFKERKVEKVYIALTHGIVQEKSGSITGEIGRIGKFGKFGMIASGREARTDFEVVNYYQFGEKQFNSFLAKSRLNKPRVNYLKNHASDYTLLSLSPKTGRTHQIRVHLKSAGNPVVADLIYCPRKLLKFDLLWCPRLFLHSSSLEFTHPLTRKKVSFKSDLPNDLKNAMLNLDKINSNFPTSPRLRRASEFRISKF